MSIHFENLNLPVGVVSADAIEQLDPFIPNSAVEDHRANSNSEAGPGRQATLPRSYWQVIFTAVPLIVADFAVLLISTVAMAAVFCLWMGTSLPPTLPTQLSCILSGYFLFGAMLGLFPATGISPVIELRQCVRAVAASSVLMLVLNEIFANVTAPEIFVGVVGGLVAMVAVPLNRLFVRKYLAKAAWWGERAVIIGGGAQGRALYRFYNRATERGLRPIGLVDVDSRSDYEERYEDLSHQPYLGSILNLNRIQRRHRLRWAIVAPGGCEALDMNQVMSHASNLPNLLILPSQFLLPSLWASTRECGGVMGVHLRDHLRSPIARSVKRMIDIVITLVALICLLPVLLVIVAWVKLKSPGPVFYGHQRIGKRGASFKAWKFRTMVQNADEVLEEYLENDPEARQQWIEDQKLKDDPRIISGIGHFLRKTSLDELPQLWNVLKGEMSLVGPRPIVKSEVDRYREMYPLYLRVPPGITGLWQVSGRNDTSYEQRVRLDSYYVCNWSIWLDLYIVLRTVRTILMREGAY
ncbi:undecaprenyl-phosphate galactose phosphotransferase WbaP [Stieleria varia]|uniref:UDP-glucose:undecaprenyl-phosphate glucose-1-phosphate transferase n=1 Tax=Stieleria varia TaxID=2528005 RepID=A0A5C6B7Z9_9BACT|nr:undecaprenyl-phosphate galactose phosphotransferase WbaP [Stieleria varia]TWU07551.1 UDP-glucose:undecaprenyl-phosphate glucose-1-phosphate transferase [Stieleria varia]